ncbi:MAG: DUF5060 domain-containing protein [Bacteroidales bacterium]|nr:DUF5060 domain-containing protein [Bacteroidales bacterium]
MRTLIAFLFPVLLISCNENSLIRYQMLTGEPRQYEKAEFHISVADTFARGYDSREVALDMVLESPAGKKLLLPAWWEGQGDGASIWKARFTPQEPGEYRYHFRLSRAGQDLYETESGGFFADTSGRDGFLHTGGLWTLVFDSGKPFRGIGENVAWESRSFEDPKYSYDYLLASLSRNEANFFRVWMCPWNFPVAWPQVSNTDRYASSEHVYNPDGIRRLDEVVEMIDSLDLYMMLAFNHHGGIMEGGGWELNPYNAVNGGPAATPAEFFTSPEAGARFRDQLRYIVARWGYSPHIGAWEFFNEVDNAVFTSSDSIRIPHEAVADWHREMAAYLKSIDPYGHIVTTSVSHREIEGMYALEELDLNQMHVYKRTKQIPEEILLYTGKYKKPFSWGEFGYEWDWNKDFSGFAEEMDNDYRTGLWYGLFHPTPILPMTWWWEFFDERNMTPYFRSVAEINKLMLESGQGSFDLLEAQAGMAEAYAVRCGETLFAYLLNDSGMAFSGEAEISLPGGDMEYSVRSYDPETREFLNAGPCRSAGGKLVIPGIKLENRQSRIFILTREGQE